MWWLSQLDPHYTKTVQNIDYVLCIIRVIIHLSSSNLTNSVLLSLPFISVYNIGIVQNYYFYYLTILAAASSFCIINEDFIVSKRAGIYQGFMTLMHFCVCVTERDRERVYSNLTQPNICVEWGGGIKTSPAGVFCCLLVSTWFSSEWSIKQRKHLSNEKSHHKLFTCDYVSNTWSHVKLCKGTFQHHAMIKIHM